MNLGNTIVMELKSNWRGYLVFIIVMAFIVGGFIQAFPSVAGAFEDDLEGSEYIEIEVEDGDGYQYVTLSWDEVEAADNYTLKIGPTPSMMVPSEIIHGIEGTVHTIRLDEVDGEIPEMYFAIVAVSGGTDEFIGIETNFDRGEGLIEFIGLDYSDLRGVLSMFWGVFFILLIGIYIAYISVNSVSKDYDDRRMDILLTKPISRRQYLLEKFSTVSLYSLLLLVAVGLITVASVYSLGELDTVSASTLFNTTVLSWPVFLVIISATFLAAVYLENSKKAVGFAFLFVLIQFGLDTVGSMASGMEYLKDFTVLSYWDHEALFYGEAVNWTEVGLLLLLSAMLIGAAVVLFERKDVPG